MDMKKLERAKVLESVINTEKRNIELWEKLFEADEVTLWSKTKPQQMYLTGKKKEEVKEIILKSHKEFLGENQKKFDEL